MMSGTDFDAAEFGDSRRRVPKPSPAVPTGGPAEGEWWDLRTAEAATGVPSSTLRRWHRRGAVASRLVDTPAGSRVQVRAGDVVAKAATRLDTRSPAAPEPPSVAAPDQPEALDTDPQEPAPMAAPPPPHPAAEQVHGTPAEAPPEAPREPERPAAADHGNAILVPLDSWQKMLTQLGNLHEAGQQLAEARERAAKAETEAEFLRERLAELRSEATASVSKPADLSPAGQPATPAEHPPADPWSESVPRSTPGKALDQLVASTRRAWRQRKTRGG